MTGKAQWRESEFRIFKSPPARRSLGVHVYETLKQAIVRGDLAPGSRVVESHVAGAMGISRTPVREAIHKLEREGFVRRSVSSGFEVAGLTAAEIRETFGIRSVLESYAARLAAVTHRPEELEALYTKIDEYQDHLDRHRPDALAKINTEFHDLLYALSRSPKLVKMINDLRDHIYRFRQIILRRADMARQSNEDHKQMLRMIERRDAEGVEMVVREHIMRGQDAVLRELDEEQQGRTY
jgi:DNA-binding GntR family transcriptional regulator